MHARLPCCSVAALLPSSRMRSALRCPYRSLRAAGKELRLGGAAGRPGRAATRRRRPRSTAWRRACGRCSPARARARTAAAAAPRPRTCWRATAARTCSRPSPSPSCPLAPATRLSARARRDLGAGRRFAWQACVCVESPCLSAGPTAPLPKGAREQGLRRAEGAG